MDFHMPQTISKLHTALLEWMHYDPDTGIFTWLKHRGKGVAGMRAGGLWSNGYRWLQFYGISASESHWAVFYMTGAWPVDQVDHRVHLVDHPVVTVGRHRVTPPAHCTSSSLLETTCKHSVGRRY